SGNENNGIRISTSSAFANVVAGNRIGTTITGDAALPNDFSGVVIDGGAHDNTIGGATDLARNTISGNTVAGVRILDAGTTGNVVVGNYIGADADGTAALGNSDGVYISAAGNIIGGLLPHEGNVVSGNTNHGIIVQNPTSSGNSILGNYVGVDASGLAG